MGSNIFSENFGAGPNPGPPLTNIQTTLSYTATPCPSDGFYTVRNSSSNCFSSWHTFTDHTGNIDGYCMIVNASYAPSDFYVKQVDNLCSGTQYSFSVWLLNLCNTCPSPSINPNITFRIEKTDGTLLQTYSTGDLPTYNVATWEKYFFDFSIPVGVTSVIIRMRNNAPGGTGNDLAIDDIVLSPMGPTTVIQLNNTTQSSISYCENNTQPITLSSTISGCYSTNVYQWQQSNDNGVTWYDLSGENNPILTISTFNLGTTLFRLGVSQFVTNSNSNCRVYSTPFTVIVNPEPTFTTVTTATTCGNSNGSVTVNGLISGITYNYLLTGAATPITGTVSTVNNTISLLAAAFYTLTITDPNTNCFKNQPVTIQPSSNFSFSTLATATICGLDNGTIAIVGLQNNIVYSYQLSNGNVGVVTASNNVITALSSNTYSVTITDPTNVTCPHTVPNIIINNSVAISANVSAIQTPLCNGNSNGAFTVSTLNTTTPITYVLGTQTNQTGIFNNLSAGLYTVDITDALGCRTSVQQTLTEPEKLQLNIADKTMPLCFGSANGSITITQTGGTPSYSYSVNGNATAPINNTFAGLAANSYYILVVDANNCTTDITTDLQQPTKLQATSTVSRLASCTSNDGKIDVASLGGTPPIEYALNNNNVWQSSNSFLVTAGSYAVHVKDNNNCEIITDSAHVGLTTNLNVELPINTTICEFTPLVLKPQVQPVLTGNTYQWTTTTNSNTINNATDSVVQVLPHEDASYTVQVRNGACSGSATIPVSVKLKPIVDAGQTTSICTVDSTYLNAIVTHSSGNVTYLWKGSDTIRTPDQAQTMVKSKGSGWYYVYVNDDYGCNFSVYDSVRLIMLPPVTAFAGNDTIAAKGLPHQLKASGGDSYTWSPSNVLNNPFISNPKAILNNDTKFVVQVQNRLGCMAYDTVFVKVYEGPAYYIPDAFSPNGDGLNDVFRPIPVGISYTQYFRIFNRFGNLVFETNKWLKGWDGTYQGVKQPIGTYVWDIQGVDKYGKTISKKGTVLLIR